MTVDIVVPAAGESVTEADIASWYKADGDYVALDDALLELETDKASMDINAPAAGILRVKIEDGTVSVGDVIGHIEPSDQAPVPAQQAAETPPAESPTATPAATQPSGHPSPAAAKLLRERAIDANAVTGTGRNGRIIKSDVPSAASVPVAESTTEVPTEAPVEQPVPRNAGERGVRRERLSRLRKTIATRLIDAQQSAALLTTFNEVDMAAVMALRSEYKDTFKEKYDVGLGFMSFFTKAVCDALQQFPLINAQFEPDAIVYHDYCDIGIAVSTPKGLVVPVVRNAQALSFNEIESAILGYAKRGRDGKLTPDDMAGGTFTITNGGVFGSLVSTPIVNRPQSAILGMHNIVKRPVVVDDEIVIRPMMYIALTYDHRLIDGKDAVQFLVRIKALIESPTRLLLGV